MKQLSLLWILLIGLVFAVPAQAAIDVNNSFSPATIYPSQTSNLQIRLLNSSLEPVTDVALTNSLPANVQLATTPNISSDCGGTFNIANGQITLSGGTIPASDGKNAGVCLLSADVTVSKKGTYVHTIATGEVTGISSTGAQSNTQDSKGTLVVLLQDLTLTLSNASGDLYLHGYETDFIRYTFTNPNPVAVTNLTLSQSLYSDPNSIRFVDDGSGTNTCGGTVSLTKGTSTDVTNFNITGGSVPANGSCTVQVKVENRRDPKLPYNFYYSSNPISANKVTTNEGATNSNSATSAVLSRSGVTVRKAFGSSSVNLYKDPTTTLTITIESDNTQAIDNFNFTDVMPTSSAGDGTMTVKSITGNTCGGTASHDATSLTITNGVLDAASATGSTPARCIISATVSYDKAGTYINTIPASDLNTYQYASATANIVVSDRLLEINKALTRAYMYQGDTNTVTLTLTNYATDFSVTNIDLKDDLNSMCVGATCPNAGMRIWGGGTISNTCGGTVIAPADATVFELRDATIAAGQTCKVSFGIKASADSYPYGGNTSVRTNTIPVGDITYDTPTQTGLIYPIDVTGKVTVYASIGISIKPFAPRTVAPMGQSRAGMTLTRTMYDPNATSNIRFEYPLPAGHVFADDVELVNGCGGTVTAIPGTSTITLSGAALPAANGASYTATSAYASSCTISFNIKAPALTPPNTSETDSFRASGQAHGAQTFFSATDDSQSAPYNVLENYSSYSAPLTRRATSVSVNKEFSPVSINGGGKSRVRIVFANTEPTLINLTKVTLTDSFSNTDMRLFTDINPTFTNTSNQTNSSGCRGGTFAGEPGGTSITLANAEIDANSTCYFEFNITAHKGGNHINTIAAGDLVTFEGVTNPADVAATLTVGRQVNVGKGFYPNVISLGETSTLLLDFFNTNTQPNDEIGTSSALVDEMPSGVQIVGTPTTTCEGGTVSTGVNASGKHYLQLSGGKFPAEGACRISATVKTTAIGTFTNTIAANDLNTVSGATNPDAVSADLKVVTKPTITKYFSPAYIKPGATTNLTFTISNPNNSTTLPTGLTGITFTDNLVDMKIASPLSVSGTCTGYKSNAVVDGTSFTVSNLRLSPSGSCTISIPVTASRVGTLPNEASGVTSDQNATPSAVAKANLYTYQPTTLTKTFNPKQILAGGTSVLSLTITNPNATTVNLMGTTSLTDLFPSSPGQMVLAATPNIQKSAGCSSNISIMDPSNTRTAAAGDTGIVIKNGYLVASSTCTISMNVTASVDGEYVNTTSALDTAANLAPAATATLSVGAPKISGVVFEDVNYGGGAGRDRTTASGIGVDGATVELYKADGSFVASTTTATVNSQAGTYTFSNITAGQYYVRVVNKSVNSTRPNASTDLIGVQTFRTNGVTAVTNEVGGHAPALEDGIANDTANPQTLNVTGYKLADGTIVQSLQAVTVSSVDINGVDFGFNFDTIVNTNDSGQGSFRQFQLNSNLLGNTGLDQEDAPAGRNAVVKPAGVETSIFEIPNTDVKHSAGVWKLNPSTGITDFTDVVKISGYTQPGSSYNTAAFPSALNTKLAIQLDGTSTTTNINGIRFDSGSQGSSVEGLAIVNWEGSAIVVKNSADDIAIQGNFIGVLPDGLTAGRNMHGVEAYTSNLTIGGSQAANRNIVSGNNTQDARSNFGLRLFDKGGHHIEGNFIGVDRTGASALRNRYAGIWFENSSNNEVRNNVIAGNGDLVDTNQDMNGITIGVGSNQIGIYGNYIGTDNTGTQAIPNALHGIWFFGNDITIGTSNEADRNIISGNKGDGINGAWQYGNSNISVENNHIGVNKTGLQALGNHGHGLSIVNDRNLTVKNNIISANLGTGIDTYITSNVSIIGNKVGVDKTGLVDLGNGRQGVHFNDGTNITVGGSSLAERNIISGNGSEGIGTEGLVNDVASADLKIINNYIGVNINGDAAIANDNYGISRWFSTASALIQDNIIAGNNSGGIYTLDAGNTTDESQIIGNHIGVDATGQSSIPNNGSGLNLHNAINQTVGGSVSARNIISGNIGAGILIQGGSHTQPATDFRIDHNYIGLNKDGDLALANQGLGISIASTSAAYAITNNVIANNNSHGIELYQVGQAAVATQLAGNLIGLNAAGTQAFANNGMGLYIWGTSSNITIGGEQASDGNIISGNASYGIKLYGDPTNITIKNNSIGLNQTGTAAVGNNDTGLVVSDYITNVHMFNNVIAGNLNNGLMLAYNAHDLTVKGNRIGLTSSGQAVPNQGYGIAVLDSVSNVIVGGTNADEANIIAFNKKAGILIKNNNTNIQVQRNSLYKNDGLAIDLQDDNVTLNDASDADTGDNSLLNFPVFKGIISGSHLILQGCAPAGASIEFYEADVSPTASSGAVAGDNQFGKTQDYGEGEHYLTTFVEGSGEDSVATPIDCSTLTDTDSNSTQGMSPFQWTMPTPSNIAIGDKVTATATLIGTGTSEFSSVTTVEVLPSDYSDAPASYGVVNHLIVGQEKLGTKLTAETSSVQDADDSSDDGIVLGSLMQNDPSLVTAMLSGSWKGYLNAWIDWNGDGDFADADEQVALNLQDDGLGYDGVDSDGQIQFLISPPSNAVLTPTYARFRYSTTKDLAASSGTAPDGEVEDYNVTIQPYVEPVAVPVGACAGPNLIANGDFSLGTANWVESHDANSASGAATIGLLGVNSTLTSSPDYVNAGGVFRSYVDNDGNVGGVVPVNLKNTTTLNLVSGQTYNFNFDAQEIFNGALYGAKITWVLLNSSTGAIAQTIPGSAAELTKSADNPNIPNIKTTWQSFNTTFTAEVPTGTYNLAMTFDNYVKKLGKTMDFYVDRVHLSPIYDCDWSDAPASYGKVQHSLLANLQLGATTDKEVDAQPSTGADGDDTNGIDDEDGISAWPVLVNGASSYSIPVANLTATGTGTMHAWIDFNKDGMFGTSEYTSTTVNNGVINAGLNWTSINVTATGSTYARLRYTSTTLADDVVVTTVDERSTQIGNLTGEVEDYSIPITSANKLSGRVFEDMNYGGGAGRDFTTAAGKGVNGATVELYKTDGTYVGTTTTANNGSQDGVYTFNQVLDGSYYVRVVNDTVNSTRVGSDGTELGVQTFRTNGTTAVTNEVGGHNPSLADGVANAGTETLDITNYKLSGGAIVQTLQPITLAGANLSGVDFGFNFDTIVNTNDSGQGSFRQFILNSNLLGNSGLAQALPTSVSGYVSGDEVSIFMIPKAKLNGTGGNANTAFIQFASALPLITDSATKIDGRTQTANIEDSNAGQVGTGGTVGTDKLALSKVNRPEVSLDMQELAQLHFAAGQGAVRGLTLYDCVVNDYNGCIESDNGANGTFVEHNIIGAYADGSRPSDDDLADAQGMSMFGQSTVRHNYFAYNRRYHAVIGGGLEGSVDLPDSVENSLVENNEFYHLIQSIYYADAIAIYGHDVTFQGNLIHNMESGGTGSSASGGKGIEIWYNTDNTLIKNNTITGMRASAIIAGNDSTGIKIERNQLHDNGNSAVLIHGTSTALMTQNSFWNNGLGIDLVQSNDIGFGDSVSLNDANDADSGGNTLLNYPMVATANIAGANLTLRGCAPAGATLELYEADVSPTSSSGVAQGSNKFGKTQDYGEGERYLTSFVEGVGEDTVTTPVDCSTLTDADGNSAIGMSPFQWTIPTPTGLSVSDLITTTSTISYGSGSSGTSEVTLNTTILTSEFSAITPITNGHNLVGRVFEDVNYGGGVGRNFTTAAGKGVNGATVELYKADGTYVGNTTTANDGTQDGVYTFNQVLDGSYYVRVVNDTVNSTRVGSDGTELGVQTFRTDGTTAVANEVGGHKPSIADGAANTGAETLDSTNYKLSGGAAVQSLQAITMAGADLSGVEFGFNFDTIVNTNDSGQGSLRQFVLNANLLDNTNLDQVANSLFDPAAGVETSIFMIPTAQLANSGANQGAAVITITSPISSTADNTAIDARTQTANIGNTNAGQLGTGGKVGVDGLTLDKIERPEVVVKASGGVALNFNGNNGVLRGIAGYGASLASANYMVLNKTSVVDGNLIGALADGSAPDNSEQNDYISLRINAASTITNNLFAYSPYGILTTSSTAAEIRNNEFAHLGSAYGNNRQDGDGISIQSPATVVGNLFHDMQGAYDASGGSYLEVLGLTTASNNTFKGAQRSAVRLLTNSVNSIISKNIITGSIAGSGVEAIANNVSVASGTITQNSIYANHTLGIDLGSNGVTLNDANDSDTGVNNLLNFPLFKEVLNVNGQLVIKGCAPAGAKLELYEADVSATSASGVTVGSNKLNKTQDYGEGERYLISLVEGVGEDTVTTPIDCATLTDSDANSAVGMSPFQWILTMPTEFVVGDKLTATATVSGSGTSEFSPLSALHLYQDRGDALASYGDPTHTITDGLYLGMQLPDRDDTALYSAGADGDGADEDGVSTLATLTTVTQTYSTNVMLTNQLGKEAWLVGWIDFNRNGTFDSNEAASIAVSAGNQHKTLGLTWSNLNGLVAGNTYLRLRLTTDPSVASAAVRDATAAALDGEVEDYKLTIKVAGQALSGTVFKDRNANGSNDAETGIGKVSIVLEEKATNTCRSVKTNAKGHYQFSGLANGDYVVYEAAPETVPAPETCPPVAADPTGYQSSTANSYAVTINDADISNQDFGDMANPSFTLDNSLVTQANTTVAHPHIFRTEVDGNVTLSLLEENLDPSDVLWKTQLLRDNNCDGKLNKGDTVINGAISLNAGDKLCVLTKVLTPANASSGATQTLTLQSEFTYGDGSVVTTTNKQTRTDITKVNGGNSDVVVNGAGKLDLKKSVWNVTRNQSGETALPGETLRYTIQYENIGNGMLDELVVHDALPNFTDLVTGSPTCVQTPTELSLCTPHVTDTAIDWSYVGKLPAGANGKVSYEVTVQ